MSSSRPPLAGHLRQATRSIHRQLDHHPLLARLLGDDLDNEDYAAALAALHGPQAILEDTVRPRLEAIGMSGRFCPRLGRLEADLIDLGLSPLPLRRPDLHIENEAELVGTMYVLEGSRLGGALILRHLKRRLPRAPRRFFAVDDDSGRWKAFWALATSLNPEASPYRQATAAAIRAFTLYLDHLDACAHGSPDQAAAVLRGASRGNV